MTFTHPVIFRRTRPGSYQIENPSDFILTNSSWTISGSIDFSADGRTLSFTPHGRWPTNASIELPVNRFNYIDWTTAPLSDALSVTQRTPAFSTGVLP